MFKKLLAPALVAFTLIAASGIASAEELSKGSTEALIYGGGLTDNLGGTFGAGLGYAVTSKVQAVGELGFISASGAHGFEFGLNGHFLFSTKNAKLTPYGLASNRLESHRAILRTYCRTDSCASGERARPDPGVSVTKLGQPAEISQL